MNLTEGEPDAGDAELQACLQCLALTNGEINESLDAVEVDEEVLAMKSSAFTFMTLSFVSTSSF